MKKNNKFSIRKYSIGVVSVIIGLFILAGANADDRVYANNESGPTSTINAGLPPISTVPEGGNPGGNDKIVDSNNDVVDKADLSKVPIPVTPGYFAIEKEVPKVASTPETVEKDYTVDFYEIGEIKYRDIKTKEIVAEKLYDNDKIDASRAAVTTLPDLPEGYEFVKQGLEREETRQVVAHELGKDPYVTDEVGIKVKLQEVNGKLAVDPNINIEADKLAPGHHLVFDVRKYIQDVEKGTKQVVEFVGAEGKAPKTNVQEGYKFIGKYNEKTKETTWNEKTHTYSSVDVPVVEKYFADKKQAGGREVTPEKPEVTDTVTYKYLGKILPVDEKGNSIAGSKTPQYLNDLKDPTKALETPVPELEGYVPTVKSVLPKDPGVDTKVVYKEKITDVEKGTKQVVEFVGAEGKAPKTNVQDDYKFKGKYHVVTKETVWKEKSHAYNSVNVPVVKGYFADKKQAGGETLTPEKPEVTDTVTYKHLGRILPIDEKGNPIEKAATPDYLNDLTDPTKTLETPVPEVKGYVPTVKSVLPKDPGVDTKVIYKKEEKPKTPDKPKETPKKPEVPKEQPKTPEKPKTPEVPKVPQTKVPEKPATPEVPKLEEKPTPEIHKKENVKLPNTGEKETETAALGMFVLLLASVLKTKKNKYFFKEKGKEYGKSILFKVFYTLIAYLESLRLTASPINPIKLNPRAVVLEEFIPVFGNDFTFLASTLACSLTLGAFCPKSTPGVEG